MRKVILLPDLYRTMSGRTKKRFAWAYLQRYHPECDPLPVQDRLESENVLEVEVNFVRARQLVKEVEERRKANKANKRRKKK